MTLSRERQNGSEVIQVRSGKARREGHRVLARAARHFKKLAACGQDSLQHRADGMSIALRMGLMGTFRQKAPTGVEE